MKPLDLIQAVDDSLVNRLFASRYQALLAPLAKRLSMTGDGWVYLMVIVFSSISYQTNKTYVLSLLLAFAIERPIYYLLKNWLRRNRPFCALRIKNWVNPTDQFSFPSGHTSAAFMFTILTASAYTVLFIPLIIWAVLIGCSRVILGVHYPTDILVGALLGMTLAQISLTVIH